MCISIERELFGDEEIYSGGLFSAMYKYDFCHHVAEYFLDKGYRFYINGDFDKGHAVFDIYAGYAYDAIEVIRT